MTKSKTVKKNRATGRGQRTQKQAGAPQKAQRLWRKERGTGAKTSYGGKALC